MLADDKARLLTLQALYNAAVEDPDNHSIGPDEIDELSSLREKACVYDELRRTARSQSIKSYSRNLAFGNEAIDSSSRRLSATPIEYPHRLGVHQKWT